ncbi:MAG: S8 family serine peptidase [Methanospirillum sp.]
MTTGDAIMGTDALRAYGITGTGIKVGVISNGLNGGTAAQTSLDLGWVYTIRDEGDPGGGEGTAMLEIIHDIAPGAQLYFHDSGRSDDGNNSAGFIRAIDALVAAGCTVIVDDVGFSDQPYFEKGEIDKHLEHLLATQRLIYVTSAGNSGDKHWQGPVKLDSEGLQDFSGTGSTLPYLYANVPRGGTLKVFLQWDEPFGSATDDFKIVLGDLTTNEILWNALGNDPLQTSVRLTHLSDPSEGFVWTNQDANSLYHDVMILVGPKGGTSVARTLELYAYGENGAGLYPINVVASDSIFGHHAVPDVITVAAVNASCPDMIETFSSNGPVTHLFPNRTVIQKPDISAPDNVAVTGSGRFHTPFSGTSAAAPHIAALCALVWSARQDLSPADIRSALYASAVDLGAPGYDNVFGWGRADAVAMYNYLATGKPVNTDPPSAFKKFYPKGGPASGAIGGMIVRTDGSVAVPDSPVDMPTTSPKKPPAKRFVRWYPGAN